MRACSECGGAVTEREAEKVSRTKVRHKNGCPEVGVVQPSGTAQWVQVREALLEERHEVIREMRQIAERLERGDTAIMDCISRATKSLEVMKAIVGRNS